MNRRKELFEDSIFRGYTPNPSAPKYDISQDFFDVQRFRYSIQAREAFIELELDKLTTGEEYTGKNPIVQNALAKLRSRPKMADLLGVRFRRGRSGDVRVVNSLLKRFGFKVSKTSRDKEVTIYQVPSLKLSPEELPIYRAKIFALLEGIAATGVKFTGKLISELGIGVDLTPEGEVSKYTYGGREIEVGVLPSIPILHKDTNVSTLKVQKLSDFSARIDPKISDLPKSTEAIPIRSSSDGDVPYSSIQTHGTSPPPQNLHEPAQNIPPENHPDRDRREIYIGDIPPENSPSADPIPQWRGLVGRLVDVMPEMPYMADWLQRRWEELRGMTLVCDGQPWLQNRETNDWQIYVNTYRGDRRTGCVSIPTCWFELLPAEVAS